MDKFGLPEMEKMSSSELLTNIFTSGKIPTFSCVFKDLCVGWIDIVDSTKITSRLPQSKISPFFCLFLSQMSSIIRESGGIVVKNSGDSLLFYFPNISDSDRNTLVNAVECGIKLLEHRRILNSLMLEIGLPTIEYRVSLDYGEVSISKAEGSQSDDIFGATVSFCAKMNKVTRPNSVVIGGDLRQMIKSYDGFGFEFLSEYNSGQKFNYPLYNVKCI